MKRQTELGTFTFPIVEAGLTNYRVDPSQGTHFFQNLTSFGVGYFTINAFMNDGIYNQEFLNSLPAVEETQYLRWVRFKSPLIVKMDGKKKLGIVALPSNLINEKKRFHVS